MSLLVELDHAQHCCHDEEHENRVQQNVLGNSDAARVCEDGEIRCHSIYVQVPSSHIAYAGVSSSKTRELEGITWLLTKYEQAGSNESSCVRPRQLQHYEVGKDWEKGAQHSTQLEGRRQSRRISRLNISCPLTSILYVRFKTVWKNRTGQVFYSGKHLPLSSPSSCGFHICLLVLWKETYHHSRSCTRRDLLASVK